MSALVFTVVLLSALVHALWNSAVKSGLDKRVSVTSVFIGHLPFALVCIVVAPIPHPDSWPFIFASTFIHITYQLLLIGAYRFGDLTQVYPVARGIAPLIVTVISVSFLGVLFTTAQTLAVVLIVAGMISLSLVRQRDGSRNPKAFWFAIATGTMIAGYSLIDGYGARAAGTALGFYGWMSIFNVAFMLGYFWWIRRSVVDPAEKPRIDVKLALMGGGASYLAYTLVMWAFTQAPIALVTALRETSIVFALLIGVFVLKERLSLGKVVATFLALAGAILLRFAK